MNAPTLNHSNVTSNKIKVCEVDFLKFSACKALQTSAHMVVSVSKNSRLRFLQLLCG